jgi:hypothetical protein
MDKSNEPPRSAAKLTQAKWDATRREPKARALKAHKADREPQPEQTARERD